MNTLDPHFLRYAGAEPVKQMFKEQRLVQAAHASLLAAKDTSIHPHGRTAPPESVSESPAQVPEQGTGQITQEIA